MFSKATETPEKDYRLYVKSYDPSDRVNLAGITTKQSLETILAGYTEIAVLQSNPETDQDDAGDQHLNNIGEYYIGDNFNSFSAFAKCFGEGIENGINPADNKEFIDQLKYNYHSYIFYNGKWAKIWIEQLAKVHTKTINGETGKRISGYTEVYYNYLEYVF